MLDPFAPVWCMFLSAVCYLDKKHTIYLSINKWLFFKVSRSVFAIHINISWSCATRETKKCKWAGTSNHSYCWLMWKHYQFGHSRSGNIGLYVFLAYNTFRSGRWWRVVHLLRNILLDTFFKRVAKCVFDFYVFDMQFFKMSTAQIYHKF